MIQSGEALSLHQQSRGLFLFLLFFFLVESSKTMSYTMCKAFQKGKGFLSDHTPVAARLSSSWEKMPACPMLFIESNRLKVYRFF